MRSFWIIGSLILIFVVFLYGLGDARTPLLLSMGVSYLIFPFITWLEKKGIHRLLTLSIVFTLLISVSLILLVIALPRLSREIQNFSRELPQILEIAFVKLQSLLLQAGIHLDFDKEGALQSIRESLSGSSVSFAKGIAKAFSNTFFSLSGWILGLLNLFLIPMFFFYVISDFESIQKELKSYIPKSWKPNVQRYSAKINEILSGYIRGQITVAFLLALLYSIGLSLVGLKFGFLIGVASGLLSLIPYVGFTMGFAASVIVALIHFDGPGTLIGVGIVFMVVQTFEGFVITPKLVGDKVGLSAFVTVLALIVGGNLLGLFGMLLAIPIAAVIKYLMTDLKQRI